MPFISSMLQFIRPSSLQPFNHLALQPFSYASHSSAFHQRLLFLPPLIILQKELAPSATGSFNQPGLSNPDRSSYVQNFAPKTLNFENQKTLVIYHDNQNAQKLTTFAGLWEIPTLFILPSRISAIIVMLLRLWHNFILGSTH